MGIFSVFQDPRSGYGPLDAFAFDHLLFKLAGPLHDAAFHALAPKIRPSTCLLDVGCGGGQFALRLAEQFPDIDLHGIDLSPGQVARAQRRAHTIPRLSFHESSALALPFRTEQFDFVYSVGSIKHWPDPELGLRECARVAKPGATVFVFEGDRGARHEDLLGYAAAVGSPPRLRPLLAAFFRVAVVGESLDLDDARDVLAAVGELEGEVARVPGAPAWAITAVRR